MKLKDTDSVNASIGTKIKPKEKNAFNLEYRQIEMMDFLKDRPAINLELIEKTCSIPLGTLRHFMKGRRNLPDKHFESLGNELHRYGYNGPEN